VNAELAITERVEAQGKVIHVRALERHTDLRALVLSCDRILRNPNAKEIIFVFDGSFRIFPNMMAPLAALLAFLESVKIEAKIRNNNPTISECCVFHPIPCVRGEERTDPSNVVWEYRDSTELEFLVNLIIVNLFRKVSSQKNTLLALEYVLGELLDNVLRHSQDEAGFFMYTLQRDNHRIAVSIADQGIGIKHSFVGSSYQPISASDAITLAMRRGVTSSADGAGNGLWTTTEIITANSGQLTITSGGGAIYYNKSNKTISSYDDLPTLDPRWSGTNIDFQIDFRKEVDFARLWGGLPSPIDTRTERLENDEDQIVLRIKDQSFGTSTRASGKEVRILATNLLRTQPADVILDFAGVVMITSSYADEVLAKLLADPSIPSVVKRLKTTGTTHTLDLVISDAIRSRVGRP
jgi:hypothetical protein